jgi:PEP-CTERM motif
MSNRSFKRFSHVACLTGVAVFLMAASASASTISYTTNAAGTEFVTYSGTIIDGGLGIDNSGGSGGGAPSSPSATLVFEPNTTSNVGTPSNIDLGDFLLTCTGCSTAAQNSAYVSFGAFTFDLLVTETVNTDGSGTLPATGEYVGTSSGGFAFSDESTISIAWSPLQIGPGGSGAITGNFGDASFVITSPSGIVAPNSGTPPGDTTVQGHVNSGATVPEPMTFSLMGAGLLGLGILGRRRSRK